MTDETIAGLRRPKAAAIRLLWLPATLAGAVWLVLRTAEWSAPLWQLWLLALVFVAAATLTVPLSTPYLDRDDLLPMRPRAYAARYFGEVTRWESRLAGQRDIYDFRRVVQDRMVLVVAERLRLRHGIELKSDANRARRLLGDELYRFCTRPVASRPKHRDLERLIRRIEEI